MQEWHQLWHFDFETFTYTIRVMATCFLRLTVWPSALFSPSKVNCQPVKPHQNLPSWFCQRFLQDRVRSRMKISKRHFNINLFNLAMFGNRILISLHIHWISLRFIESWFVRSRRFPCAATCGARAALVSCRGTWAPLAECILEARYFFGMFGMFGHVAA